MKRRNTAIQATALLGILLGSLVVADPPADLLRGPDVADEAVRSNLGMLDTGARRRASRQTVVPAQAWFEAFRELDLTEAQRSEAEERADAFRKRVETFRKRSQQRLRDLNRQIRRLEASGAADEEALLLELRPLKDERDRLQAESPKATELQLACWKLLGSAQQDDLRQRLEVIRSELRRKEAIKRLREQATPISQPMEEAGQAMSGDSMSETGGATDRLPASLDGFE